MLVVKPQQHGDAQLLRAVGGTATAGGAGKLRQVYAGVLLAAANSAYK